MLLSEQSNKHIHRFYGYQFPNKIVDQMTNEPTTVVSLQGLPWSIAANISNSFFIQLTFFGPVIILFLIELGLNMIEVGFVLSLIPFSNVVALLLSPTVTRLGYKRMYIIFGILCNIATIGLLSTPWILSTFGNHFVHVYIVGVVGIFGLFRAVAETAYYPWNQEFIPNSVRRKYTITNNTFMVVASVCTLGSIIVVLSRNSGLAGFMILFATGLFAGLISTLCSIFIPRETSKVNESKETNIKLCLSQAVNDRNFILFLVLTGIVTLYAVPICSFGIFYMIIEIGLTDISALQVAIGTLLGTLIMSSVWNWLSIRYAGKHVMALAVCLRVLALFALWYSPKHSIFSLYAVLAISLVLGFMEMGWGLGSTRLLYMSEQSFANKANRTALYLTWIGIWGGSSLLFSTLILRSTQANLYSLDYAIFFPSGLASILMILLLVYFARKDRASDVWHFAGVLLRGNAFGTSSVEFEDLTIKEDMPSKNS